MERRIYRGWPIVVALGVVTIVSYGTTQYLFGVLVDPVTRELGGNRAQLASAYSIALVVAAVAGLAVGRVVDRIGARLLLCVGGVVNVATLLLLSRTGSLPAFATVWAAGCGIAMALTQYPLTFVVVANWFDRRRPAAMALLTTIGGLSSPIMIPLAGWLVQLHGWRTAVVLLALPAALTVPLSLVLVRRRPEDLGLSPDGAAESRPGPSTGLTLTAALRTPAFWLITLGGMATMFAANAMQVNQVAYLIARGLSPVAAASVAGLAGLASVPGRIFLNLAGQRLSPQWLLGVSMLSMGLGVLVLLLTRGSSATFAYAILYGAGYGAATPLRGTVMARQVGRRAFGAITAVQNLAVLGGSAA
ncbi:MAG: MFS transporter, partial [Candidatus Dormibacteraeota bacterium]|nr:MFS transporter [Candidatus Dormibacteraeota bacterium]